MPFTTAHTLGGSGDLQFSPAHFTFTQVPFLNNRASHESHLIITVAFTSCPECFPQTPAYPCPQKWVWFTVAGDDKIERTEGFFFFYSLFFFFFLEPQKKLPHKSILNCKAFLFLYSMAVSRYVCLLSRSKSQNTCRLQRKIPRIKHYRRLTGGNVYFNKAKPEGGFLQAVWQRNCFKTHI